MPSSFWSGADSAMAKSIFARLLYCLNWKVRSVGLPEILIWNSFSFPRSLIAAKCSAVSRLARLQFWRTAISRKKVENMFSIWKKGEKKVLSLFFFVTHSKNGRRRRKGNCLDIQEKGGKQSEFLSSTFFKFKVLYRVLLHFLPSFNWLKNQNAFLVKICGNLIDSISKFPTYSSKLKSEKIWNIFKMTINKSIRAKNMFPGSPFTSQCCCYLRYNTFPKMPVCLQPKSLDGRTFEHEIHKESSRERTSSSSSAVNGARESGYLKPQPTKQELKKIMRECKSCFSFFSQQTCKQQQQQQQQKQLDQQFKSPAEKSLKLLLFINPS